MIEPDGTYGGTPLYMAPEIIDGGAPSVRSDIYSLGWMLYQISIGNLRRPLAPGWEEHLDDILLREDIAAATASDPERRLASVAELIERLQSRAHREMRRQQIAAAEQRAVIAERALERARARRPWLIAALASLVLGLGTSLWLYYGEAAARYDAQREAARTRAINEFMNELLRTADPDMPGGGNKMTLDQALEAARARLKNQFDILQPRDRCTPPWVRSILAGASTVKPCCCNSRPWNCWPPRGAARTQPHSQFNTRWRARSTC